MVYRAIGLMSGSSLDGLDIVFAELEARGAAWSYDIKYAGCAAYSDQWLQQLQAATQLNAHEYLLLHSAYGRLTAELVLDFIDRHQLHHQVQLIASHGHTVFHAPASGMTAQLGDGATIAALTGINVVSDLRAMDVALGGQGAPIVPMGEKLLFPGYEFYLNIGGIANISGNKAGNYTAFDICPANRVLNMLAQQAGKPFDEGGMLARSGSLHVPLLTALNQLEYYAQPYPKSLANSFGTDVVFPLIQSFGLSAADALRTYTEHIVQQTVYSINRLHSGGRPAQLLVTGGGAFNTFLIQRLQEALQVFSTTVVVPDDTTVLYKEALIMALLGVLRWREENTVLHSVTGATRSSIGGAVWIGQEA